MLLIYHEPILVAIKMVVVDEEVCEAGAYARAPEIFRHATHTAWHNVPGSTLHNGNTTVYSIQLVAFRRLPTKRLSRGDVDGGWWWWYCSGGGVP